jgi:outer membrane protein
MRKMRILHSVLRTALARFLIVGVALVAWPAAAVAQSSSVITLPPPPFTLPFLPSPTGLWTVAVGGGGELKPDFEGAKRYTIGPIPIVSIYRAGSLDQFRSPRDGASLALLDLGAVRAGPVAAIMPGRTASRYAELNGLGDVKAAIELGGFAEYFPVDWFRARVEVRRGFGGNDGVTALSSADLIVPLWHRLVWSGGPRFSLSDTRATAPYFSIDQAQALASGLPVFDAKGGAHAFGAGTQLRYQITPQWETHGYVEYDRLLGDAAASPLVTLRGSPNQAKLGIGASYSFDVRVP